MNKEKLLKFMEYISWQAACAAMSGDRQRWQRYQHIFNLLEKELYNNDK
jgi:hypothetical protein